MAQKSRQVSDKDEFSSPFMEAFLTIWEELPGDHPLKKHGYRSVNLRERDYTKFYNERDQLEKRLKHVVAEHVEKPLAEVIEEIANYNGVEDNRETLVAEFKKSKFATVSEWVNHQEQVAIGQRGAEEVTPVFVAYRQRLEQPIKLIEFLTHPTSLEELEPIIRNELEIRAAQHNSNLQMDPGGMPIRARDLVRADILEDAFLEALLRKTDGAQPIFAQTPAFNRLSKDWQQAISLLSYKQREIAEKGQPPYLAKCMKKMRDDWVYSRDEVCEWIARAIENGDHDLYEEIFLLVMDRKQELEKVRRPATKDPTSETLYIRLDEWLIENSTNVTPTERIQLEVDIEKGGNREKLYPAFNALPPAYQAVLICSIIPPESRNGPHVAISNSIDYETFHHSLHSHWRGRFGNLALTSISVQLENMAQELLKEPEHWENLFIADWAFQNRNMSHSPITLAMVERFGLQRELIDWSNPVSDKYRLQQKKPAFDQLQPEEKWLVVSSLLEDHQMELGSRLKPYLSGEASTHFYDIELRITADYELSRLWRSLSGKAETLAKNILTEVEELPDYNHQQERWQYYAISHSLQQAMFADRRVDRKFPVRLLPRISSLDLKLESDEEQNYHEYASSFAKLSPAQQFTILDAVVPPVLRIHPDQMALSAEEIWDNREELYKHWSLTALYLVSYRMAKLAHICEQNPAVWDELKEAQQALNEGWNTGGMTLERANELGIHRMLVNWRQPQSTLYEEESNTPAFDKLDNNLQRSLVLKHIEEYHLEEAASLLELFEAGYPLHFHDILSMLQLPEVIRPSDIGIGKPWYRWAEIAPKVEKEAEMLLTDHDLAEDIVISQMNRTVDFVRRIKRDDKDIFGGGSAGFALGR
jgi:hypothetical protein